MTYKGDISDLPAELVEELVLPSNPTPERDEAIVVLRNAGWDMAKIGRAFGISRQRVDQILRRREELIGCGYTAPPCGYTSDPTI